MPKRGRNRSPAARARKAAHSDITKRAQLEHALRESEKRFRVLVNSSPALICTHDLAGKLLSVNPAGSRAIGYSPQEMVGKDMRQWLAPSVRHLFEDYLAKIRQQGKASGLMRVVRKDGEERIWLYQNVLLDTGNRAYVIGNALDITERKRDEEALRLSEQKFACAFRSSPHSITISTLAEERLVDLNESFVRLTGYQREEAIGRTWTELNLWVDPADRKRMLASLREHGRVQDLEFRFQRKSGKIRQGLLSAEIIHLDGHSLLLTTARDITENKRLEAELRQSQKMETIGRLAGGIAHDFNNLLTGILGYSDLLLKRLPPRTRLRVFASHIKKSSERAATLTSQLLAFSRQQILRPEVLDLNTIVADLEKMLRRLIGEDIELVTELDPDLRPVSADRGQIEQVIFNLAVNARDAMPSGGKLTIGTANGLALQFPDSNQQLVPGENYVGLSVRDTGCGIDAQTISQIFDPFFTTKDVGKGTGLGLSMVYGIVTQTGGCVLVDSQPGRGSTFHVYLPQAVESTQEVGVPKRRSSFSPGSETILVVEDEEVVRSFARTVLRSEGYNVLVASCGEEAIAVGQKHRGPIHLLLADVVMPGMNGREAAEHLAPRRPEMKVLYISGYTDDVIVKHGVLKPEAAFLQKPFNPEALSRKVREVLDEVIAP